MRVVSPAAKAEQTAPAGAQVPAAIRAQPIATGSEEHDEYLTHVGTTGAMNAANVITTQAETIRGLRAELRARCNEIEALRKHIEQMSVLA